MTPLCISPVLLLLLAPAALFAAVTPAPLFQDHAVLQRDKPIPVWGVAAAGEGVTVVFAGQTKSTTAAADGRWSVTLDPLPASAEPATLTIVGENTVTLSDILVGEVWLASGQSNMAFTLAECGELETTTLPAANDPDLRFFTVARQAHLGPQDDTTGTWLATTPATAPGFSAVAYHHAARLRRELGVPVGVIVSSWGGTPIEAWMSPQAHARSPHLAVTTAAYARYAHSEARWAHLAANPDGSLTATRPADPGLTPDASGWAAPAFDDSAWPVMRLPSTWQRHGHTFSGVFWFRRTVSLPAVWRGSDLVVELGAADKQDIAFVNGTEIGRTGTGLEDQHWNRVRRYTIPAALATSSDRLVLAVRVYSFIYDGGLIGPASSMRLLCPDRRGDASLPLDGDWCYAIEHDFGPVIGDHDPGHLTPQSPHILFDNLIAPLAPYALRGALWYQGERNVAHADLYADLLRDLIDDWRRLWCQGDFPFLVVQLPAHHAPCAHDPASTWARLREAQLHVAQTVTAAHLAITLDVGEAYDIHPKNKAPAGHRLAQLALAAVHARDLVPGGPLPLSATRHADGVRVSFNRAGSGLATSDGQAPRPIFLGDAHGAWHEAAATLHADHLHASASTCPAPVAIAYAWADNPAGANLANRDGFPASPFRLNCA